MVYKDYVATAERTLRILESIVASQVGLSAAQLSTDLEIPRSAVYALLNTLTNLGYITQDGPRKPYKPGSRLWHLAQPHPDGRDSLITAFHAETSRTIPEETFALTALSGNDIVVLAEIPGKSTVRCVIPVGKKENAATHPAGRILLAGLPPMALSQLSITNDDRMQHALKLTRQEVIIQHKQEDVIILAAPICPNGHTPEAALMLCCPAYRWSPDRARILTTSLHETAARISHRLGAVIYRPYAKSETHPPVESVPMTQADLEAFLEEPWAARLACLRHDGTPHVVPVWYEYNNGAFMVVAWPNSVWAALVTANPFVALSIDEPWPPMRRVMIRGEAVSIPPKDIPGGIYHLRQRISSRYLGNANPAIVDFTPEDDTWSAFRITPQQCIALKQMQPEV